MSSIKIGGREITLHYYFQAVEQVEEEVCIASEIKEALTGENRMKNIVKMIRILGNNGLSIEGKPEDLTDKWLKANMRPGNTREYLMAILSAVNEDMKMETEDEDAEHDVGLEEIKKKSDRAD